MFIENFIFNKYAIKKKIDMQKKKTVLKAFSLCFLLHLLYLFILVLCLVELPVADFFEGVPTMLNKEALT